MGMSHAGHTCEGHSCVIISASNGWSGPGGSPLQAQEVWDLESLWTEQAVQHTVCQGARQKVRLRLANCYTLVSMYGIECA